ncbi:MAG: hypothetical protein H8D49_02495 [Dehalococcoidia bacterium]|nr:hypothetical protein [Dehalococcoidia bacterium]MBL7166995.1 hypothetical protein [Dehalococcoidales bacterium]
MQVQVGNYIYPLVEGQPLQIPAGSTLRVFYSFSYKVAETTTVPVWAALYTKTPVIGSRIAVEQAQRKTTITLDTAIAWQTYQGQIEFTIGSGVKPGVYGLGVESSGFKDAGDYIDDCIEVTAAPGMTEWMGPLMMIAMLGMMTQTTE